jgi:hypothetical protein
LRRLEALPMLSGKFPPISLSDKRSLSSFG